MENYQHLFRALEEPLREELQEKGRVMQFGPGECLLQTGQAIRNTIFVLDGLVKLYREEEEGREFFMYYLEPGDSCALSMICDRTHYSSAVMAKTVTDTTLLIVPISETESWMRKYRSWNAFVVGTYRRRYEELLETIDSIAFKNLDERLEFYLRRHSSTLGTRILKLTNTEIAQELSTSREVISRLMKKLAESGKVRLSRSGVIEILSL
ncbi:MAG: Crp/Fnr family transcriptional regulator [Bacteroidetes bacterium]|nr:MAG: Crp/Fnr family transcriptional regulator [Bacteroidota bacterium]